MNLDLDRLDDLHTAATPGPWRVTGRHCDWQPGVDEQSGLGLEIAGPPEPELRGQFARWSDAALIAEARNALPDLIAAARNDPQPLLDELRETGWEWLDGGPLPSGSWMIRLRNAERRKDAAATGPTLIDALRAVRDIARAQ